MYEESDTASVIDEVIVQMNATGNIQKTTTVESMKGKDPLCEDVVGLVGSPYSIETESVFDTATISFKIDMSQLNEKSLDDYIVLWYDEENYKFVEMDTTYDVANGIISTETTHFSRYMIVDADAWFEAWSEELNYSNIHYEESRVYTVLAVDCSGSMSYSDPITSEPKSEGSAYYYNNCKRYEAVSNYVKAMDSDDKASIVTFDHYAYASCAMTDDKIVLTNSEGSTRKKIVLLSDGESSVSDSVLESAKTSNIKIYTIGLGNSSDSVLQHIAVQTGGQFFKAYTADELLDIYDGIGDFSDPQPLIRNEEADVDWELWSSINIQEYMEIRNVTEMIFKGVHEVAFGRYHTSVLVFALKESIYYDLEHFTQLGGNWSDNWKDIHYVTFGAGPASGLSGDLLTADYNRTKDIQLDIKVQMVNLTTSPAVNENINLLLENHEYYCNLGEDARPTYNLIPGTENEQNSNSYAVGLLNASGIDDLGEPIYKVPGYKYPLASSYFGEGE